MQFVNFAENPIEGEKKFFLEKQHTLTFRYAFYPTDGQLLQVIQDMYGAGTDTSTNTVMWYVSP